MLLWEFQVIQVYIELSSFNYNRMDIIFEFSSLEHISHILSCFQTFRKRFCIISLNLLYIPVYDHKLTYVLLLSVRTGLTRCITCSASCSSCSSS